MLHPNQFEKPNDWPKIDKTFDYKIENGKLLSGNEHIYLSGPVTYNIVGNPTIVDGIVTDFTRTSYLRTNLQFDFSQTDYEFVIRATPHAVSTRSAAIVGTQTGGLRIYFQQNSIQCYPGNDTVFSVNGTFDVSSFYYVRLIRKGNVYTLDYSLDGTNYTSARSLTSQQHLSRNLFLQFGYYANDGWDPLDGKIDINHTYIKVNDRLWFYGKNYTTSNIVPVPKGLEYNNTTTPSIGWVDTDTSSSNFQQFTSAPEGTMIGKDDAHSLAVETPIVNGELLNPKIVGHIDYTVVGNPTIVDGVASGFSSSDYLQLTSQFDITKDFECIFQVKTGPSDTISNYQRVWFYDCNGANGIWINNRVIYWWVATNDSSKVLGNGNYTVRANTDYLIRARHINGVYYLDHSIDNGTTWRDTQSLSFTHTGTTTQANTYLGNSTIYQNAWLGSIDLNETYIKVNNILWFGKENWKPSTYTDNSIYLLAGHKTDYSSYNELDFTPTITNNDTYNVIIDNQEVFTNMSGGTHIEWDKLDLTTGYNITTPSTLKTHVIKISPTDNTKNITKYYCDSDYVIKDGKLVWADPMIYLEATGTQYINTGIITNSNYTYETKVKFVKLASGDTNNTLISNNTYNVGDDGRIGCMYRSNVNNTKCFVYNYYTVTATSWVEYDYDVSYTLKTVKDSSNTYFYINDTLDKTNPLETLTTAQNPLYFWTGAFAGESALGKIFNIKLFDENKALVGHFVPVPAGLIIGNFTVPSNGMFDIVNQQFYANQGTGEFTYGKDSN